MIRVAITGPESTGKSILAEQLSRHYNTSWVPEFAREYLGRTGGKYSYGDILKIAKGQLESEQKLEKVANSILFSDTECIVTQIWCEVKYGKVHPWIIEKVVNHRYDLYLLCNIDLPWQQDPLREHPGMREQLFNRYLEVVKELKLNYRIVSGIGPRRLENAISIVNSLFAFV